MKRRIDAEEVTMPTRHRSAPAARLAYPVRLRVACASVGRIVCRDAEGRVVVL